jgi:predicted TIM-barrel fold metal-dependent hydrolase
MEPKMQITRIEVAEISEADRRKILYENARKLLHLK